MKRMNSLPLSPVVISFHLFYLTQFYWENRCYKSCVNTVALNSYLGLSVFKKFTLSLLSKIVCSLWACLAQM